MVINTTWNTLENSGTIGAGAPLCRSTPPGRLT